MVGPTSEELDKGETVSLLQDLGLKEYEARCFLALSQVSSGTAKEISELSEVPRTRVYDAVRVLEAQGLVTVQHSSPRRFRAVSVEEATETLRQKYEDRIDALGSYLESLEHADETDEDDQMQEVWSLTGHEGIESRMRSLVESAEQEVLLVVVDESILTDRMVDHLREALDRGVDVVAGVRSEAIVDRFESELPGVRLFETELDWLVGREETDIAIGRIVLVDRSRLLVSSFYPDTDAASANEMGVYASGLNNGVVVLIRRLVASGLLPARDSAGRG